MLMFLFRRATNLFFHLQFYFRINTTEVPKERVNQVAAFLDRVDKLLLPIMGKFSAGKSTVDYDSAQAKINEVVHNHLMTAEYISQQVQKGAIGTHEVREFIFRFKF